MSAIDDLLVELRAIRRLLEDAAGARSSVEIDSNGKAGELKLKVKEYQGSEPPLADAIANYKAGLQQIMAEQMAGWAATVEDVRR